MTTLSSSHASINGIGLLQLEAQDQTATWCIALALPNCKVTRSALVVCNLQLSFSQALT